MKLPLLDSLPAKLLFKLDQKIRFVLVGGYNVIFGIILFMLLHETLNIHYLIIATLSNIVSIINNFMCFKFFVFRTGKNYIREFFRTSFTYILIYIIYISSMYLLVTILGYQATTVNAALVIPLACLSYVLHKNFSFKVNNAETNQNTT